MNREQAEKLLTAFIFEDLDEDSQAQLRTYLETDDELRERMVDLRMAVKVTRDAIHQEPEPVLNAERLEQLEKLAKKTSTSSKTFILRHIRSIAAILVILFILGGLLLPSLQRTPRDARVNPQIVADHQTQTESLMEKQEDLLGGTSLVYESSHGRTLINNSGIRKDITQGNRVPQQIALSEKPFTDVVQVLDGKKVNQEPTGTSTPTQPGTGGGLYVSLSGDRSEGIKSIGVPNLNSDSSANRYDFYTSLGGNGSEFSYGKQVERSLKGVNREQSTDAYRDSDDQWGFEGNVSVANGSEPTQSKIPALGDMPIVGEPFVTNGPHEGVVDEQSGQHLAVQHDMRPTDKSQSKLGIDDLALPPASRFKALPVNPWVLTEQDALSTFALDVDTASYTLCRRYIRGGFLPPVGAVRREEFINAFDYHYPQRNDTTFAVYAEAASAPLVPAGSNVTLMKIAVKARTLGRDQRKAAQLVWVVDTSASMGQPDRLPVVQQALHRLTDVLDPRDRVSLVTCDREARLCLEAVSAQERDKIHAAVDALQSAGSTQLAAGLKLGYATARRDFQAGQINHVVLCSDGIANVGQTEADAILAEVAADRLQGITTTCVGVGYGAYNDVLLESLADRGDGSYLYLDTTPEAQEILVQSLAAGIQCVARDARIQVAFNPARVRRYRLIGYENRDIADARFRDDTVDAGEVGSGQCSTALYEMELTGSAQDQSQLGSVTVRYLDVASNQMAEITRALDQDIIQKRSVKTSPGFYLAATAAYFAEWLRQSPYIGSLSYDDLKGLADQVQRALPLDQKVADLAQLIHQAEGLPQAP